MKNSRVPVLCLLLTASLLAFAACSRPAKTAKTTPAKARPAAAKPEPAKPAPEETRPAAKPAPLPVVGQDYLNGDAQAPPAVDKAGDTEKETASLLEEGISVYQDAQAAIDRGDMDAALAKLDEAYALLLRVKVAPDSPLMQEKNDLRTLIAQRIQQVNASRLTVVPSVNNSIPLVENEWVKKEIISFQTVERQWFEEAYKRAGLYREMIITELHKAGLPEQLAWLPMIESWFKVRALSRARALGMWQFISSTGYRYGLKKDKYIDERMDPVKSTKAAVQYLSDLHDLFGDWTTALAAYNCGEGYVQKMIRGQRIDYLDNFWDLFNTLPWQTARYVPRFIASLMILQDPAKYGFTLPAMDPSLAYETVRIATPVKLASLAQSLGVDPVLMTVLNPELRFDSTPNYDYDLRVPQGYSDRVTSACAALPSYIPADAAFSGWHTVRKGETLGEIARRYRTYVSSLVRVNNLRSATMIYVGQRLRIPGTAAGETAPASPPAKTSPAQNPSNPGETITYVVKPGDTLYQIAKTYNTSVEKIKADNGLKTDDVSAGQKLVIQSGRTQPGEPA